MSIPPVEALIERLASENETWRVDAESRLIALGPAAVEPLLAALGHPSTAVRLHAVHALMKIGDPRGIPFVARALGDGENLGAVAIAAEKALVEWGAPAKPALLEVATSGPEALRPRAIRALGRIGGPDLEAPLRALLTHPAPAVRSQAAAALAACIGERAIEAIAPLLADGDKWVRYGAAETLVRVGSARGEGALREARADPEEQDPHTQLWVEELLDEIEELRRTGRARP